jgi:hypothetical protein
VELQLDVVLLTVTGPTWDCSHHSEHTERRDPIYLVLPVLLPTGLSAEPIRCKVKLKPLILSGKTICTQLRQQGCFWLEYKTAFRGGEQKLGMWRTA